MNPSLALLDKAKRSPEVAETIFQKGDYDFSASRAYYSYFYIAEALLATKNLRFSSHKATTAQYGLHFAKDGVLPPHFHQKMIEAFELRQIGDYSINSPVLAEDVEEVIREGWAFLEAARVYLASLWPNCL